MVVVITLLGQHDFGDIYVVTDVMDTGKCLGASLLGFSPLSRSGVYHPLWATDYIGTYQVFLVPNLEGGEVYSLSG